MNPDSSAIDATIIGVLQNDPTLKTLMPDGAYFDEAPPNVKRFVLMGVVDTIDRATYANARAGELVDYFVKAVGLSTASPDMRAAAKRIDELLGGVSLTPPAGYAELVVHRDTDAGARIRDTEVDKIDASIRWFHRGGWYRAEAAIAETRAT